jgi:ATP-binding cassette subfamily F protein 3
MIRFKHLTLARGGRPLLEHAEASILPGERIALVGPNGSGKSTLLAALLGDVTLESGEIDLPPTRMVRLDQHVPGGPLPAWRFVEQADHALAAARLRFAHAQSGHDSLALAEAHDALLEAGDSTARSRVKELLSGLGFSEDASEQPVEALSGGWRMRLNLARALFVPSDLLLLDEPTNHLDLDAIVWFERWLTRYPGTVIAVSHDRDFLDRIAQATLSIEGGKLVRYAGGYSAFESQRAERLRQATKAQAEQRARVEHLTAFIERFRAKATKAKQVQSRIKALEKLAEIAPMRAERGVDFQLPEVDDAPDPLILARDLIAGYAASPADAPSPETAEQRTVQILRGVSLTIDRGARIGVLGRNGAGKSTLIRTLVGELPALGGECRNARSLRIGYFSQHGIEDLRDDETPVAFFQRLSPQAKESSIRDELGRFGFRGEDAVRPIGPMSGGEKARLVLATIVRTRPHLLVLDEPTNHLDGATRDALTDALAEYDGAVLLVSHDRYLLRASVDRFVLVHDGVAEPFDGDLDDYLVWLQRNAGAAQRPGDTGTRVDQSQAAPRTDRREERRIAAERRQALGVKLKPLQAEIRKIEGRLPLIEARIAEIETTLSDPAAYDDPSRATALSRERAALSKEGGELETRWLELSEACESLEREAAEAG